MPWVVQEEDLRKHFESCGTILNVRIIRDPSTFIGKGFGYIQFSTKVEMKNAVAEKHNSKFKGRELRVKRAVESKRLEKKQKKKRETKSELKEREIKQRNANDTDSEAEFDSRNHAKPVVADTRRRASGYDSSDSDHADHDIRPFLNSAYRSINQENDDDIAVGNNIKVNKKQKLKV